MHKIPYLTVSLRQARERGLHWLITSLLSCIAFILTGNLLIMLCMSKQTLSDQIALTEPLAIFIALLLLFYRLRPWSTLYFALALSPLALKKWVWVSILALILSLSVYYFGQWTGIDTHFWEKHIWPETHHAYLLIFTMIIAAPLFEELIFRGCLPSALQQMGLKPVWIIGLIASSWVVMHWQYDWSEKTLLFGIGCILALLRLKTGTVWAPLWCHVLFNSSQLLLSLNSAN